MKRVKKLKILILSLCMLAGLLGGCKQNIDDVKLSGQKELVEYSKKYCQAELVDYVEEQYVHTAYFIDRKTNVEFTIQSAARQAGLDVNSYGYKEVTHADFITNYVAYFNEQIDCGKYHCKSITGNESLPSLDAAHKLHVNARDNITEEEFTGLCQEIKEKDVHGFFRTVTLSCQSDLDGLQYSLDENKIINQ